jgi:glucose uptake protein
VKGIILAMAAGLLLGGFVPLMEKSRQGDLGLGPYAASFLFALAVFLSTFVYEIFFVNLPVEGDPVELGAYLTGSMGQHLAGFVSGCVWFAGTILAWVCASVPEAMQPQPTVRSLLSQGAPVLAALWGIVVFRELKDGDMRVKVLAALMLVLLVCGMAMLDLAPVLIPRD